MLILILSCNVWLKYSCLNYYICLLFNSKVTLYDTMNLILWVVRQIILVLKKKLCLRFYIVIFIHFSGICIIFYGIHQGLTNCKWRDIVKLLLPVVPFYVNYNIILVLGRVITFHCEVNSKLLEVILHFYHLKDNFFNIL